MVPAATFVQQVVPHGGTPDTPAPPCTPVRAYRRAPGTPVPAAQSKAAARPPPREDAMSDDESDNSLSSDVEEHVSEPARKGARSMPHLLGEGPSGRVGDSPALCTCVSQ